MRAVVVDHALEAVEAAGGDPVDRLVAYIHYQAGLGITHRDEVLLLILMSLEYKERLGEVNDFIAWTAAQAARLIERARRRAEPAASADVPARARGDRARHQRRHLPRMVPPLGEPARPRADAGAARRAARRRGAAGEAAGLARRAVRGNETPAAATAPPAGRDAANGRSRVSPAARAARAARSPGSAPACRTRRSRPAPPAPGWRSSRCRARRSRAGTRARARRRSSRGRPSRGRRGGAPGGPQVRRLERVAGELDALDRDVLDEEMRCDRDHAGHRKAGGMEQRDRAAVAVPNSHGRSMPTVAKRAGSTSLACCVMKSTGQCSSRGLGVELP